MHQLIKSIFLEFSYSNTLTKTNKLTETKSSFIACELILIADEDQLSLEDLIIFFELNKKGKYMGLKTQLTYSFINEKLELFRQERYEAYIRIKEHKVAMQKTIGPLERISPEPTAIRHLFDDATGKIIPLKKIS